MVKRNIIDWAVIPVWTFFRWRYCSMCKKEFKREYGWCCFKKTNKYVSYYFCKECCEDQKKALAAIDTLGLPKGNMVKGVNIEPKGKRPPYVPMMVKTQKSVSDSI